MPLATPAGPTPPPVQYVADYCLARDWLTPYYSYEAHALTVLDPTYALPADYAPPDLVSISTTGLVSERGDELIRAVLVEDLRALQQAASAAGLSLLVESGYRSFGQQQQTLDSWVARIGYDAAVRRVARPGHSEHQLGTAVDFTSPGWTGRFGDWAVESPEGAWLAQHGVEYGLVMSFPAGADALTCLGYEPWHYRWIGRDLAAEWAASGVTLHEFLVMRGSTGS